MIKEQKSSVWIVAQASVIFLAVFVAVASGYKFVAPKPYDPLSFPKQSVTDTLNGASSTVHVGSPVHTTATKCSTTKTTVVGTLSWQSVEPPGTIITVSGGAANTYPGPNRIDAHGIMADNHGCLERSFIDIMPDEVQTATRQFYASGLKVVVWVITGSETPNHPHAVTRTWMTNPIYVVP